MDLQWHVLHVMSRTEKKVAERLEKKGFWTYVPMQRQLRQWSDRKKWVDMVVMSGYVFVKIDKSQHLPVLETAGVSYFLKFERKPVIISEEEMSNFQRFIKNVKEHPIEFTTERLPVGTFVTIQSGHFKGLTGEVILHKGSRKLTVQLSHIGHWLVDLSMNDVAEVELG